MPTALITGASSGIGYELANIFAEKGNNLVLVARSESKLQVLKESLEEQYGVSVVIIIKDLTEPGAVDYIFQTTEAKDIIVDYLINNAGFGEYGVFHKNEWQKEKAMIDLNITALTYLTKLYLKKMVSRDSGRIMNVASTAAFQPGPLMAVYYATKAYVLHFSEAIANELKGTKVTVTALCPGATESNFSAVANMKESKLFKGQNLPSSRKVAEYGYNAMMKGKTVAIQGFKNKLLAFSVRFAPRSIVASLTKTIQAK